MTPYQALANAIVELAVKDYKKASSSTTVSPITRNMQMKSPVWSGSSVPVGTVC